MSTTIPNHLKPVSAYDDAGQRVEAYEARWPPIPECVQDDLRAAGWRPVRLRRTLRRDRRWRVWLPPSTQGPTPPEEEGGAA